MLQAALFLEEIPRADSECIQRALLVSIISCERSRRRCGRNRAAIVHVVRFDVIPLQSKPHGRVDIVGEVDNVLRFRLDKVVVDPLSI